MFSHEAPTLTRPKEPPPPPPPVEQVLLPVIPPRKFFPMFTSDELERINSVINGQNHCKNATNEDTETIDEFSCDEFSEDEFDDSATYENLNVYDSVPDLAMEEDSLEEKMSFGPEYYESDAGSISTPLPTTSTPVFKSLVEKASEKTIIYTSHLAEEEGKSLDNEILISSSSWINLQGNNHFNDELINEINEKDGSSMAHCVVNSSSSIIGIQGPEISKVKNEAFETYDSLEPVKPPRLKKMAKLKKLEAEKIQATKESLDQHLKDRMFKISNCATAAIKPEISGTTIPTTKPDISSPILVASTLNPNDMDGHKSLTNFKPPVPNNVTIVQPPKTLKNGESKITFKDLKRYASTSFASLSSNLKQVQLGRSSFYYEADTSQDSIYEDASKIRQVSPTYSEHIYEEIPERNHDDRPLPPIPETKTSTGQDPELKKVPQRRHGSIFEGASKYEILHYLKDAKDRLDHKDFEMSDLDETYLRRNHNHRVSAISNVSDSSSDDSSNSGGSILNRLKLSASDIERTDSGVGSETSKSSKASVEIRRAPSLSKSSDSGSGKIQRQTCGCQLIL